MKTEHAPHEAKFFKFRFTPLMIMLAIAVILLCAAGTALSIWRIAEYGVKGFNDVLKSPFLIAICLFGIAVVVALLIRSRYVITKDTLTIQFGFIKSKFAIEKFTSVLLDTDSKKITVYMGEEFFVVTTSPEWNNDFVQALREVKPDIEFSFTLAEYKEEKK
ncbi:MAG: PH domain-containing protein [Clostridia bacterium]|nr:PH domain-containing protein [Clostridia bacterium]